MEYLHTRFLGLVFDGELIRWSTRRLLADLLSTEDHTPSYRLVDYRARRAQIFSRELMFCGGDSFTGDHSGGGKRVGGNGLSTCFFGWDCGGFWDGLRHVYIALTGVLR